MTDADVVIIGAGIIGLAVAWYLQEGGRRVVLVDRRGVAEGASFGNAGALAFSDVLPLATSGVMWKVPKWLLDPLGPLTIPPAYLPRILPWLLRFWRAGWPDRMRASIEAQSALMRLAAAETERLLTAAGLQHMIRSEGSLELYESESELTRSLPGWTARREQGIAFEHVRGGALDALQPGLAARFVAGTFVPGWRTVTDPYEVAIALARAIQARGGILAKGEIVRVVDGDGSRRLICSNGLTVSARQVVIAAGAWSKPLAAALGDRIPLETERGYNTTLPPDAFDLRRQLIFGGHGFVITPLTTGIRIGGAVELGGLQRPPNFARSRAMLSKAAAFLPGLRTEGGREWMGFRPSLPDTLPVIGPSRASADIVYAFGHGHLGLTQAAATGRLVADLLDGRTPAISLQPLRPDRF